jgi:flagellar biosynthesis GTPase FlhF
MSSYYDDEEDLDIHIRRGRPASPVYHERHYQPAPPPPPPMQVARPVYYTHGPNYLVPEGSSRRRSHSTSHRGSPERAPVIVNNIYKDAYDSEEEEDRRYLQLGRPIGRARSRSRPGSYVSPRSSRENYELEQTRKELEVFKLQVEREKEEKRLKKEMELKRLREEREAIEEKERMKKETKAAIEKYKLEEAEKAEKARKEKEEREKEYQQRIRDDLRKSGMNIQNPLTLSQLAVILRSEGI